MSQVPLEGRLETGDELRGWLLATLATLAPAFTRPIGDETALADDGLCLSSIELMELTSALEERLGVVLSEADVTPENFGTVGRLLGFLRSLTPPP